MLCCLLVTVHGDRSSLEREYEHAFGRKLGTDLESQMLLSYHKLMQQVPGRFLSKREVCKRQRTYPRRQRPVTSPSSSNTRRPPPTPPQQPFFFYKLARSVFDAEAILEFILDRTLGEKNLAWCQKKFWHGAKRSS